MIIALELPRDVDLLLFSQYLSQTGVVHRVSEEGDKQVVWVRDESTKARVVDLYQRMSEGEVRFEVKPGSASRPNRPSILLMRARLAPLTVSIIVLNVLLYPATFGLDYGDVTTLLHAMTFSPFEIEGRHIDFAEVGASLAAGEYWRLLSPMFIHFSIMHIVFNLLWVWEIGRRIEQVNGRGTLLLVVLVSSFLSNVTQYIATGPGLFGGMSGVVFGLLGFSLVWSRMVPHRSTGLPSGIYIFMLVFLAAGFFGVFDFLLQGQVANGAHLGGLIGGLVIGVVASLLENLSPDRES